MALEALSSSNELLSNFIIYDTISATPYSSSQEIISSLDTTTTISTPPPPQQPPHSFSLENNAKIPQDQGVIMNLHQQRLGRKQNQLGAVVSVQGRKKRRRKARVCKNKEEAETQRMTHIAVERNRRKQMNEHLSVLRSLMPESYVQRGDQASIVGGAIEFVKELEHILQSLEAQKLQLLQQQQNGSSSSFKENEEDAQFLLPPPSPLPQQQQPPFSQFFLYPQYTWSQNPNKHTTKTKASIADIEVTLIETHANLRILSRKNPKQLSKLVAGFHSLHLSILHLNVTTIDPLVLYSISAKVEEGCQLNSVDDIAAAVHHMLRIIEEATNVDGEQLISCP